MMNSSGIQPGTPCIQVVHLQVLAGQSNLCTGANQISCYAMITMAGNYTVSGCRCAQHLVSSHSQILQPELDDGAPARQPVVSTVYDRHKATLGDELGKPRLLGAGNRPQLPPDHVFGKPSQREPEPCVGES